MVATTIHVLLVMTDTRMLTHQLTKDKALSAGEVGRCTLLRGKPE